MAALKHWLMQTPKELLENFSQKDQRFVVLKTNIYLFQGEHVLLVRPPDGPAARQEEEWVVPRDVERIDRPASHPSQQQATTIPLRNRVLTTLAKMQIPHQTLRELQFLEFSKKTPLYLPDGDTLHIWALLSAYNTSLTPDFRAVLLTHLTPSAKYRWASPSDLDSNVTTPATDTDRTNQLHILDLKNAFLRLHLCSKAAFLFENRVHALPDICHHIVAATIEARVLSFGEKARHGMVVMSTHQTPPYLALNGMRAEQMTGWIQWPETVAGRNGKVYKVVAAFTGGMVKWFAAAGSVPWRELYLESGRVNIQWP